MNKEILNEEPIITVETVFDELLTDYIALASAARVTSNPEELRNHWLDKLKKATQKE